MKMRLKKLVIISAVFAITAAAASVICFADEEEVTSGSIQLSDQKESEFPGLALITFTDAIKLAQSRVRGELLKAELENENSYLVYGIEIVASDKSISDVKVDAGNGKVLLVEKDTEDSEKSQGKDDDDNDNEENEVEE